MSNNLVVNPFLQLLSANDQDAAYQLIAPKPQRGLQIIEISKSKNPNLHELFLDLAEIGFNYLDCEKDIDETERELLYQSGVLVESDNAPEKPLFACLLDDVKTIDFNGDASSLIVNPTFRFEPFNFANFLPWIHEKHLSPHKPSVWLKQTITDIEIGYWLENNQAETVSKFAAGEKLSVAIEPEFLSKLVSCGILTTRKIIAENEQNNAKLLKRRKLNFSKINMLFCENFSRLNN